MKAIVKEKKAPGLVLKDIPRPAPKEGEVLIKTRKTAICGTDLHIYKWDSWAEKTLNPPLVIGHEFMGEIAELGEGVTEFKVGERVSGEGHFTCGICSNCKKGLKHLCIHTQGLGVNRDGCFAQYFTLPKQQVFPLPDDISDEIGAILDPFGNAVHTALSFDLTGEDVLITGAGPIGIMAAAVAKKCGARNVVITDRNEERLILAKKLGATYGVNILKEELSEVRKKLHLDEGFTVGLEMSGSEKALNEQIEHAINGAKIALLGILPKDCQVNWHDIIFKMISLKGIYGREIFSTWFKEIHLLQAGLDLSSLITDKFEAVDFEKGFAAMESGKSGKVILSW